MTVAGSGSLDRMMTLMIRLGLMCGSSAEAELEATFCPLLLQVRIFLLGASQHPSWTALALGPAVPLPIAPFPKSAARICLHLPCQSRKISAQFAVLPGLASKGEAHLVCKASFWSSSPLASRRHLYTLQSLTRVSFSSQRLSFSVCFLDISRTGRHFCTE